LGGLYALERLAQDNMEHRQTTVNVLCAYLRMPFTASRQAHLGAAPEAPTGDSPASPTDEGARKLGSDEQQELQVRLTAQRILRDHLRPGLDVDGHATNAKYWRQVTDVDLTGATLASLDFSDCFFVNASFSGATFTENTSFHRATFTGITRFYGATFSGTTWFEDATFAEDVVFREVTFFGCTWFKTATFTKSAEFDGAIFHRDAEFGEANFNGADFSFATFTGNAWFRGVTFSGDVWLDHATFTKRARFHQATFNGNVDFREATLHQGANLSAARARLDRNHEWPPEWTMMPFAERDLQSNGDRNWAKLVQAETASPPSA
jgi:uncharacterized protein YjbI with pentapeptide repeats